MTIDKNLLLEQIANFEAQLAEALAVVNKADGAIQVCKHLVSLLDKEEES